MSNSGVPIVSDIANAIGDFVEDAADNLILPAFNFLGDVAQTIGEVTKTGLNFAVEVIKNPGSVLFDPMKVIGAAIAYIAAPVTGGASLYIYWGTFYAINSGMITQLAVSSAKQGWVAENHVAVLATIGNIVACVSMFNYGSLGNSWLNSYNGLVQLGVSVETAVMVSDIIYNLTLYSTYLSSAFSTYDIYNTFQNMLNMEKEWKSQLAAFEAWLNGLKEKTTKEDSFITGLLTGDAMKYYPGQPMFASINAGREYYTSVEGQFAGSVMLGDKFMTSDISVARITFDEPSFDLAGNSGYMNSLSDYPKFWRSSVGQ